MKTTTILLVSLAVLVQHLNALPQQVVTNDVLSEEEMVATLQAYDQEVRQHCNRQVQANWNVATDTENKDYEVEQNAASLAYAAFRNDYYERFFKDAPVENYKDEKIRKQLRLLKDLGTAALPTSKLEDYNRVMRRMDGAYQLAEICPYDNQQ
ncbi:hypothetical protein pipiens_019671, partial [Culex pipiens pipiens]